MGATGTLVAVGGGEDKRGAMDVLSRVLGDDPGAMDVAILPTASSDPLWACQPHVEAFRALGSREVHVVDLRTPADAAREEHLARLRGADVVYMTGGDQSRLVWALQGTPALAALQANLARGGVVAGTSAGAAAMSAVMIASGESDLRKGSVGLAEGLGLLPDLVIDTHFTERGRFARLLEATATHPRLLGVGLGEDTALLVRGDEVEVVGSGNVTVVDAREMVSSNVAYAEDDEPVSVERAIVHVYGAGRCFRLDGRPREAVARRARAKA